MNPDYIFKGLCAAVVVIMMIYYIRRERKLLSLIFGCITGLAGLMLLNKYGLYIGTDIPLNLFNVISSCVLGIPYVICIAVLEQF